jgi:hypothetical protein
MSQQLSTIRAAAGSQASPDFRPSDRSRSSEPEDFDLSGCATSSRIPETPAEYLTDFSADAEQIRFRVDALNEDGLRPFNYDYYYLNILSLFGHDRSIGDIRAIAIACAKMRLWGSWRFLTDAADSREKMRLGEALTVRLAGWDREMLAALMQQGRGLIISTFHYGPFRYILDDLMAFGFRVVFGLDADSAHSFRKRFRLIDPLNAGGESGENPIAIGHGSVRIIDVERSQLAGVALMKALRRNEIVLLFADGNCGLDGPRGATNKTSLQFLNCSISVKAGISHLAAASGAPILPVYAVDRDAGAHGSPDLFRGQLHCDGVITPGVFRSADRESFAAECMSTLFGRLSELILEDPTEWEGAHVFHRWRARPAAVPGKQGDHRSASATDVAACLAGGGRLRLNHTKVACIPTDEGVMLVSVKTLQVFRLARDREWLLAALSGAGVSRDWLAAQKLEAADSARAMKCLTALVNLGFAES